MLKNQKFGLKESSIEKIEKVFSKNSKIQKVIIYGSRAKGNFSNASDIDLTIFSNDLSTTDLFKITNELDDLMLPYKIDLSIFNQIDNQKLREHIQRVGLLFYQKKTI